MFLGKKKKKEEKNIRSFVSYMHLPNPLSNDLYRGQMFAPMVNKPKTPLTASADAQGELGVKILSLFLQDAGPEWRW